MRCEAVRLMSMPDFRPWAAQLLTNEVCPSELAPILGGAPVAFRRHIFRWSTKACVHCGCALAALQGSRVFFEKDDDPSPEEWHAYCGGVLPCP